MDLKELTPREHEIFALAASGVANIDIADELGISENAVRYHLKEIHSKLETGGRRSLLRWHRFRVLGPGVPFGSRVASAAATSAVFGVVGVLAVGAVLTRPSDEQDSGGIHECPTAFSSWPGATFADFASIGEKSVGDIGALNPGLSDEQLAAGSVEVNVGSMEHTQCMEADSTITADEIPPRGTPRPQ